MRVLCLKDQQIEKSSLLDVYEEVFDIYRENTDLEPEVIVETRNFSNLPFEYYNSKDRGIAKSHIKKETKEIKRTHKYEVDLVDFMVHEDSWVPGQDGIWGWNLATAKNGYEVEQTRWDKDNLTNSEGTLYHEIAHSHDSFVYRLLNKWLESVIGVQDWDDEMVHGQNSRYQYIQHDENQDAIAAVADYLEDAVAKRRKKEQRARENLTQTKNILEQIVELYRELIIWKNKEDKPITKDLIISKYGK